MKILFDWRLSRVIDDQGNIVDEILWDGPISPSGTAKRLSMIQQGRRLPEVTTLSERFPEAEIDSIFRSFHSLKGLTGSIGLSETVTLTHLAEDLISEKHSNFFVNKSNATYKDMKGLIDLVKNSVREKKGINLDLEIEIIG